MSLLNQKKKPTKALLNKESESKTVTLLASDWEILTATLSLMAENVGRLGIEPKLVGNVYQNCLILSNSITEQTNGIKTNINS